MQSHRNDYAFAVARKKYIQGEMLGGDVIFPTFEEIADQVGIPHTVLSRIAAAEGWEASRKRFWHEWHKNYEAVLPEAMKELSERLAEEAKLSTVRAVVIWKKFEGEILRRLESGEVQGMDPKNLELLIRAYKHTTEGMRLQLGKSTANVGIAAHLEGAAPEDLRAILELGGEIAKAMDLEGQSLEYETKTEAVGQ